MFNEKRTLLFLNHQVDVSFRGKRWAYAGPEKPAAAPESKEKLTPQQRNEVLSDLLKRTESSEWDTGKGPSDNFDKLAKKLYPDNPAKQEFAKNTLDNAFGDGAARAQNASKLSEADCKYVRLEEGQLKFYKNDKFEAQNEIKLPTPATRITTPEVPGQPPEKKEGQPAAPVVAPEKKEKAEMTPEQKAALEYFKKAFPQAKPDQIRISPTETIGTGQKGALYLSSYMGTIQDPDYYNDAGQGRFLQPDNLRGGAYVPAEVMQGFVVEAPKKNGVMGKFVYVKMSADQYVGGKSEFNGWVEVGKLRNAQNHDEVLKTENAWTKEEYTAEKVNKGTYPVLSNTVLYSGKGKLAGTMLRMIEKGDRITVASERVRMVGDEEYVYATFEKNGSKDVGWVRKETVMSAATEKKAEEVAFKAPTEERADEAMVAKYYDRETGKVHFNGDKQAEKLITISDLFPNAKEGDKIRIKHASGGKSMEAFYNPDKEYVRWIKGKMEKHKGTFFYKNGQRVEIWDGDVILPAWEKEGTGESLADQEKRSYVEKRTIKEGETYQSIAQEAMFLPAIKKAFEGSKFSSQEKLDAYAALLKKYQTGNELYLVIPNPTEAGIPTAEALAEERYTSKADQYAEKFRKNREATEKAFRGSMHQYLENQVILRKSMLDAVNDDELWKKAWNGEGSTEIAGLDNLISVLKHPIFVEAGITEQNAREKILDLIQEGKNDRVDFEDVLDSFKIYIKKDGEPGKLGDYKDEVEENTKIMKENEKGMQAFEAKKGSGILKQTEIVKVVQEKMRLAEAQGLEPYSLVTKDQAKQYVAAVKALDEVKNDPDYQQWDKYRLASVRMGYLNYVLEEGGMLLQALGQLQMKQFKEAATATPEKMTPETGKCAAVLADVFHDSDKDAWRKDHPNGRSFAWEDVVAGTSQDESDTTAFGKYFDENAPVLRERSRLNKYTNEKGELDGVERMNEKDTCQELNRLMHKALLRLIAWKNNPTAAAEFINRYASESTKVNLPAKNSGETDEAYATRVAPMLTQSVESAFQNLKINNFGDLQLEKDSPEAYKQRIQDRKDLIRMGYYFDSRDEEKGLTESKEAGPQLSMNPMIRKIQEDAIAKGYPAGDAKKIESIFLGGIGLKIDTTKPLNQAFGVGLGTGIDLGQGFTLMVGVGVDQIGPHPNPMLGVAIRKGWKLDEAKRTEIGVSGGVGVGLTGPSIGGAIDFTWPVSSSLDMKAFAGGSAGILVAGVGGGIGIGKNFEAAQKNLETQIGGVDTKEIDAEKDPDKKYMMIINNPKVGPYFRSAASQFSDIESQKKVVLDLYQAWRSSVGTEAAKENSAPFISGGGIVAGFAEVGGVPVPFVGPYLTFTVSKTTLVYRRQSESSKDMDKVSEAQIQEAIVADAKKKNPGTNVQFKEVMAGQSGDVMVDAEGNIAIRKRNAQVDLAPFKEQPSLEKYNEALKPYDMKLVPDAATGLLEFQVFGALGNLQILMDPGMEKRGLVLKGNKVYLAPGANPELFITREDFYTPFPKKGSPMNTIVTITDTPKRTRSVISDEVSQSGSYLYRKSGKQWELVQAPNSQIGNTMYEANYNQNKANLETFHENVPGFNDAQWKAYEAKINGLPFVKEADPDLTAENVKELKDFSKKFLKNWTNLQKYKEYTTVTPNDSEETINTKRKNLAALIQLNAKEKAPKGLGTELNDLQMNFVMSELMDLSFTELEKAPDKRARFEQNLEWSKNAVLLPFFRKKIPELQAQGYNITSTPEQLTDLLVKRLLSNVQDQDLGKPGQQLGPNWLFSSVAGAVGTGLRGVPGYITQDKYGVLGLHEEDLSKSGVEGDLAKVILEMESPLDRNNDKTMAESPLAKKLIAMPGMWFVLGDTMANQAVEGMQKALNGETIDPNNAGFQEFKKILKGIRDTQLSGGNAFIYNAPNGNSFEFRLDTKVADAAHARCGNASFGVNEGIQIFARIKPGEGMLVAAGKENVATVSPETTAKFVSFGLAGVVTIEVGHEEAPPPPHKIPPPPKENKPGGGPGGKSIVNAGEKTGGGEHGTVPGKIGGDTGSGNPDNTPSGNPDEAP